MAIDCIMDLNNEALFTVAKETALEHLERIHSQLDSSDLKDWLMGLTQKIRRL